MTEDRIEPLCQHLFEAIRDQKNEHAAALACELLAGFLADINRLARATEQIEMDLRK